MSESPRVTRYRQIRSDNELDQIINIPPKVVSLDGRDGDKLAEQLDSALRGFFQSDRQIRKIIRYFLSTAQAHAETHLVADPAYVRGLYNDHPWGEAVRPAICLTGLAGTGKSDLLRALSRVLGTAMPHAVVGHSNLSLLPLWHLSAADGIGLNTILRPFLEPPCDLNGSDVRSRKAASSSLLMTLAKRVSWRDAVCLLLVDELQYVSLGSDANTLVTAFLVKLLGIGPRVGFCANFSLLHKLLRRKQEDHQRLLSRPLVMEPLTAEDLDWVAYLGQVRSVAPDVLVFDPRQISASMHLYTFGTRRLVVELVVLAFRIARERSQKGTVGGQELLVAYRHRDYTVNREAVEMLHKQAILKRQIREDLWCPLLDVNLEKVHGSNVLTADHAIESFERRVEDKLLDDVLRTSKPRDEDVLAAPARKRDKPSGSVVQFRGRKTTKDDLVAGARALEDL